MSDRLIAFHGDPAIKRQYLRRVRNHRKADELVKGQYWQDGKGCAVGCTIHSGQHSQYEVELGIPRQLAYLEDRLFENLPNGKAKAWPEAFLEAIPVGADLLVTFHQFIVWLLVDPDEGVIKFARTDRTREAIQRVADLYQRLLDGGEVSREEWRSAAYAASAASAAYAAYAAYAADAADAAGASSREEAYIRQSERLLELLKLAPAPSSAPAASAA